MPEAWASKSVVGRTPTGQVGYAFLAFVALFLAHPRGQTLTPEIEAKAAYVFPIAAVTIGDTADITYWVDGSQPRVRLEIRDQNRVVISLAARAVRGVYHATWDLRMIPPRVNEREAREEGARLPLPLVPPGAYTVALIAGTREHSRQIEVRDDPRVNLAPSQRAAWTAAQVRLWQIVTGAEEQRTKAFALREQAQALPGAEMRSHAARLRSAAHEVEETSERAEKLLKRIAGTPAPLSGTDARRIDAWQGSLARVETEIAAIQQNMRSRAAKDR
jgi:hypothetical protein